MEAIKFVGEVRSPLKKLEDCPLQENEQAPQVIIKIYTEYRPAISGLNAGTKVFLFTWLHKGNRETLLTKPRNNPNARTTGIFATRSPDRPNPIGLHMAEILDITPEGEIKVSNLEVLDRTPVIDIKPCI
jgi:tRNA-Thr(GGU) m(6)t(6)A37 methyltransferase TsaA